MVEYHSTYGWRCVITEHHIPRVTRRSRDATLGLKLTDHNFNLKENYLPKTEEIGRDIVWATSVSIRTLIPKVLIWSFQKLISERTNAYTNRLAQVLAGWLFFISNPFSLAAVSETVKEIPRTSLRQIGIQALELGSHLVTTRVQCRLRSSLLSDICNVYYIAFIDGLCQRLHRY